ncbi:MAG TPA: GNAT family N-acetyltransferase [bacterium]|nr:GNAT family N-acetyltransferase [bacterium]
MVSEVKIEGPFLGQSAVCEPILRSLPEWFAIEDAVQNYLQQIDVLPTWLALTPERAAGFFTVKLHFERAAELIVLAVRPEWHRQGIGRTLLAAVETYLRDRNVEFLQVKTLSERHPDPGYAKTRAFYTHAGFAPLEEFPTLWSEDHPCLQMIKYLGCPDIF